MTPATTTTTVDERGDDADTDTAPATGHGAVATRPFPALPITAVPRDRRLGLVRIGLAVAPLGMFRPAVRGPVVAWFLRFPAGRVR